jgi:hypothetical protein
MPGRTWNTLGWSAPRSVVGGRERREEQAALLRGDVRAGLAAGGADEAEEEICLLRAEQGARVGAGAGGLVAVVELDQFQLQAGGGVARVEVAHREPAAGREGAADFSGAAGQRHRLPEQHDAGRAARAGLRRDLVRYADTASQQQRAVCLAQPFPA